MAEQKRILVVDDDVSIREYLETFLIRENFDVSSVDAGEHVLDAFQHAVYGTPNRHHGYCSDDNARALIVASMGWSLFQDDRWLPHMDRYLGFLHYAHVPETNRFRNTNGHCSLSQLRPSMSM